jgi:hypothetical protein
MSFIKIIFLLVLLSGCTSKDTPNSYEPGCSRADAYCIVEMVAHGVNNSKSNKKCSDMVGEQKKSCDAQVESLTKHINDATKQ